MSDHALMPTLHDLMSHQEWLRGLARHLVEDAASADDLVQEVWLAALKNPPQRGASRGWLAQVARNLARMGHRGEARRDRREQAAARPEAEGSSSAVAERAAACRDVVDHVLALSEPYREAVLLRWFEGLPPRAIAARLDIPVRTVESRLRRGHLQLRQALEVHYGGRRPFALALVPLAVAPRAGWAISTPAWAATLVLLAGGVAGLLMATGEDPISAGDGIGSGRGLELSEGVGESAGGPGTRALAPEEAAGDGIRTQPFSPTPVPIGRGEDERNESVPAGRAGPAPRLVDVRGRPLEGMRLRRTGPATVRWTGGDVGWLGNSFHSLRLTPRLERRYRAEPESLRRAIADREHPEEWLAAILGDPIPDRELVSGSGGAIELDAADAAALDLVQEGWALIAAGRDPEDGGLRLVGARSVRIEGLIQDEAGAALERVKVTVTPGARDCLRAAAGKLAISREDWEPVIHSMGDGAFVLRRVPAIDGVGLRFEKEGFETLEIVAPAYPTDALRITLAPARGFQSSEVWGTVVDPSGTPVGGAEVWLGKEKSRTDEDGRFRFVVDRLLPEDRLTVLAAGFELLQELEFGARVLADAAAGREIRLQLAGEALAISGRVLDADGEPITGAAVVLADPTRLQLTFSPVESRLSGQDRLVMTDEAGSFRIEGLSNRSYRLRVGVAARGITFESEAIPAGTSGVVLQAKAEDTLERLAGRIVDAAGNGLAGVRVGLRFVIFETPSGASLWHTEELGLTDGSGRFAIGPVPVRQVQLEVGREDLGRATWPMAELLARHPGGEEVLLVHPPAARLRVDAREIPTASTLEVVANDGTPLELVPVMGGTPGVAVAREGEGFALVAVSARGTQMILRDAAGGELGRWPLTLRPGQVTRMRPR